MIQNFLNIQNSLRDLSDEEFENIVKTLAIELENVDYRFNYSDSD